MWNEYNTAFFSEASPMLCKDSANREKRMLVFFSEVQPILCKDSANRTQSSLLEIAEVQPILCKDTYFNRTSQCMHRIIKICLLNMGQKHNLQKQNQRMSIKNPLLRINNVNERIYFNYAHWFQSLERNESE